MLISEELVTAYARYFQMLKILNKLWGLNISELRCLSYGHRPEEK